MFKVGRSATVATLEELSRGLQSSLDGVASTYSTVSVTGV